MGKIVDQEPCPGCRAKGNDRTGDNLCVYDDGTKHCHACDYDLQKWQLDKVKPIPKPEPRANTMSGPSIEEINGWGITELKGRGISLKAAEHYGVRTRLHNGVEFAHAYPLTDQDGQPQAYQVRKLPKQFMRSGDGKGAQLFGQNKCPPAGKMIVITEGQDDTLAAFDLFDQKGKNYKVVGSLGTSGWKDNIEYLETFEKVMIAFDQDKPGQDASKELADALTPGKGHIVKWTNAKDVNDLLNQGRSEDFFVAIGRAKAYEVGGILTGEAAWNIIRDYKAPEFVPYPSEWADLNDKMQGLRKAEISVWCAGSSIGKTSFMRRIKQHIVTTSDWKVADIELEERPEKTIRGMLQYQAGIPMHQMTDEQKRKAHMETYGTGRLITLDHRANKKGADLLGKFRYLHHAMGANIIFLDHVTLGVREFGDGNEGVDAMMEDFLTFVEQTGVHLALISHLRKPPGGGKTWSQGAVPAEEDMKGSGSLYQIAFDIIGMSRNKQHENPYIRNVSTLHSLKCRETGNTGPSDRLYYNPVTRLLEPADEMQMGEGDDRPLNNFGADEPDF